MLGDMENSLDIRASVSLTKDLGKSRKEFDEKTTESCDKLLKLQTPQFDTNLPISGLSSGVMASESVVTHVDSEHCWNRLLSQVFERKS